MKNLLAVFVLFFFPAAMLLAQPDWKLTKEQNGIQIFIGHADSSSFKSIKVHTLLEGTPAKLLSILRTVEKNKDWVYSTRQVYLIKKVSNNEFLYYAETTLPWPMNNRDQPIRMTINQNPANQSLVIVTAGEPESAPRKNGLVRIPYFYAKWDVFVKDATHLDVTYYLQVDPGGNLPPWIVNLFVTKGPYESFYSLAGLLKKEKT